ncbi:MAG: hypothetical protein Q7Q73_01325 [Verrucomicrobiota bacterium JB024]|nr:hypothetical protein [Verrucomicrobiota bacterium JB024]
MKTASLFSALIFLLTVSLTAAPVLKPYAEAVVSKAHPATAEASAVLRVSARGTHAHKTYLVFDANSLKPQELESASGAELSLTTLEDYYLLGSPGGPVSLSLYLVESNAKNPALLNLSWSNAPANDTASEARLLATVLVDSASVKGDQAVQWDDPRILTALREISAQSGAKYLTLLVVSDGTVSDPGFNFYSSQNTSRSSREPRLLIRE